MNRLGEIGLILNTVIALVVIKAFLEIEIIQMEEETLLMTKFTVYKLYE